MSQLGPPAIPSTAAESLAEAITAYDQGHLDRAAPLLQSVLQVQPNHGVALHYLGRIARQLGMPDRAERMLRQALRVGHASPQLLNDLGAVFVERGDMDSARRCFQRCIDHYPTSVLGYVSLAYLENQQGEFQQAETLYLAATGKADQPFEAEFNLATLYREWGRLDEAAVLYRRLIEEHANALLLVDGLARTLLQQQEWRQGWEAYEARLEIEEEPGKINLTLPIARWRGESLRGKHLLVLHEQGIGDEVQFASCYPDVISRTETCTITCSPRLRTILQRSFDSARFIPVTNQDRETWRPSEEANFDFFVPAGSLPRYFRMGTDDFSGHPFLKAERSRSHQQRSRQPRRVGVSWWGGAVREQIRQRSVPFEIFQQLFDVENVQFVNLQHGCRMPHGEDSLAGFSNLLTDPVDPYVELEPWFELLVSLDLIISVDNSNVHFAGALGVPTWLLLGDHPNWRWSRKGETSPWYSSVELIHKSVEDNWVDVMRRVANRLRHWPAVGSSRSAA